MKSFLVPAAVLVALASGPALASSDCNVPMAEWQPRESLQVQLEGDGWQVLRIRSDDGCYKVDGVDAQGRAVEATFDPKSFDLIELERED